MITKKILPTLLRDTREHKGQGWRWNKTKEITGTIDKKLDYGDYSVEGLEGEIVVERKGSATELINNLFSPDKDRFLRELDSLSKFKRAWIICEFNLDDVANEINKIASIKWFKQRKVAMLTMKKFLGYTASLSIQYGVEFIFAGKYFGKELAKRLLLKAYKYKV